MFLFYCMLAVPVHAQTAKVYNFKLVHNFDDNGRKMLKMCFHYMCSGAKGHTIYPVAFVDKERGNPTGSRMVAICCRKALRSLSLMKQPIGMTMFGLASIMMP